jgi:hypothetical protein
MKKFQRPPNDETGAPMTTLHLRMLALSLLAAGACATSDANHVRPAVVSQEQCCHKLTDTNAQHACLADIPRTQDESSPINQETFQCVERHFSCDAATGRATRDSAQQQLDCLNDLESTQQARNETPAPSK